MNQIQNLAFWSGMKVLGESCISLVTQPLNSIKFLQQIGPPGLKAKTVALDLFKTEGIKGFYQGYGANLGRIVIMQSWSIPALVFLPPWLEKRGFHSLSAKAMTGGILATMDALGTIPLEKARIASITKIGEKSASKMNWQGVIPYWMKLSTRRTSTLVCQELYLSTYKTYRQINNLNLLEQIVLGAAIATTVSAVSIPFDTMNTRCQSQNKKICHVFSTMYPKHGVFFLFTGFPIRTLTLTIQQIATIILLDKMSKGG